MSLSENKIYRKLRIRYGPRKFRAFGVGPGKTGTHSLSNIFSRHYRSAHEADSRNAINLLLAFRSGYASEGDLRSFIRDRDRRLKLEMDCASYNSFFAQVLVSEFPEAKFILTVRNCFSWANSAINQLYNYPEAQQHWLDWRKSLMGSIEDCRYDDRELVLKENQIWNLDSIYNTWAVHYQAVLDVVPPDRMLVIRIEDMKNSFGQIADFLEIPETMLDARNSHAFRTPNELGLLEKIDHEYVSERAEEICGSIMRRFYPGRECEYGAFMRAGANTAGRAASGG